MRAGLAAAVAVVAVVVGLSVVGRPGPVVEPPSSSATTDASVPDGWRLVGLDGVMVYLPADWRPRSCGSGTLAYGPVLGTSSGGTGCTDVVLLRPVVFGDMALQTEPLNGLEVVRYDRTCDDTPDAPAALCAPEHRTTIAVPDRGVELVVTASGEAAVDLAERIVATLRPMPEGSTAVPAVPVPGEFARVCKAVFGAGLVLGRAGLDQQVCGAMYVGPPITLVPAPGTVVPNGSVVEVENRIALGGVSVAVPRDWVPEVCAAGQVGFVPSGIDNCESESVELTRATTTPRGTAVERGGFEVIEQDWSCPTNAFCVVSFRTTLTVVDAGVQVVVSVDDRAVIDQIIASLAPIPDGLVAVPPLRARASAAEAEEILAAAGLVGVPERTAATAVTTNPAPGTLVSPGTEIGLVSATG
ncbi:PASTA domain-containing protein [Nocardioides marinquilinus]|uniref:PASTA domain-containing protein n=1 Tax=Nocardioides marinquilinus TaxID=1210400 RepID=UPI0031E955BF